MNEYDLRLYLINHLKLRKKEVCPMSGKPYTEIGLFLDNHKITSIDLPIL